MKARLLLLSFFSCLLCFTYTARAAETEPNNTPAQANVLPLNGSNSGIINPSGDVDWYKVTTTGDGKLFITLNDLSNANYLNIYLFDNSGTIQLTATTATQNNSATVSYDGLAAGTYYALVTGYNPGDTGTYSISSTLTLAPVANDAEPDSSRATALTLPLNGSATGHIGYLYNNHRDSTDFYKVTTNTDGRLRLQLTDYPTSNNNYVSMFLYDNDGVTLLNSGTATVGNVLTLNTDGLAVGTYYVRVQYYNPGEYASYMLADSLFAAPIANDAEPDSSRATALTLPLNGSATGHIGYLYNNHRDSTDFYKVTTNADGLLRFQLTDYPTSNNNYVSMFLYDNDGVTLLNSGTATVGNVLTLNTDGLAVGTYYVRVQFYNSNEYSDYKLADSLFAPPVANDAEPDSTRALALTLPLNGSVTGHVGYYYNNHRDSSDWYKLTTNSDGLLRLRITTEPSSLNAYVNYYLFDNDGTTLLNSGTVGSNTTANFNTDGLAAGTYYVRMSQYNLNDYVSYVLADSLFAPPVANDVEPNNSPATADSLPLNTTISGHVGYYYNNRRDSSDWYRVTTNTDGMLQFKITTEPSSLNAYINYALYDSDGTTVITASTIGSNTTNTYNIDGLMKGTYYLRMYQYNGNDYVSYVVTDSLFTYQYAADTTYEPNDYALQAKTILSNRTTTGHFGFYHNGGRSFDNTDWFRINYTGTGNLSLTLNHQPHLSNGENDYVNFYVYKDTSAAPVYSITFGSETTDNVNLTGLSEGYYYIKIAQYVGSDFEAYSVSNSFTQTDIATIAVKSTRPSLDSCGGNSITYNLGASHSPYGVQLYRNGIRYDSVNVATDTARFNNLPAGIYYATVYGDGATDAAFSTSGNTTFLPPTPKGVNTTNILVHTAKLNWTPFSCVKSYRVQYRLSTATAWTTLDDANDAVGTYTLTGLTMYTNYTWRVASVDTAQSTVLVGAYSDTTAFRTLSDTAIITRTKFTQGATCNSSSIKYTSTHSVNPYTVQLYRNGAAYGNPVSSTDTTLFTGLPAGIYYATSSGTGSGGSFGTSGKDTILPPAPTGLSTSNITIHSAKLNWTPLSCESNYRVQYRLSTATTWTTLDDANDAAGMYTLTTLTAYTSYTWRVASVDTAQSAVLVSSYSDTLQFITLSDTAHIVRSSKTNGTTCNSSILTYTLSNSVAPYTVQLYRYGAAYGSATQATGTATFSSLPTGIYYATATGTGSGGSLGTSGIDTLLPPVPSGLDTMLVTATSAQVKWTPLSCASYFTIQYRPASASTWTTVQTEGNVSTDSLLGLTPATLYVWRLAAVDTTAGTMLMSAYPGNDTFMTMQVLPVTLISFTAKSANNTVQLSWQTANEINSSYYAVQRSADGITFSTVGTVQAGSQHQYSFTDNSPAKGNNYYRLRQTDRDGRYTDSKIVIVSFTGTSLFTLYPNPAVNVVHVNLYARGKATLTVYNNNGKAVVQKVVSDGATSQQLNVSGLAAGTYMVVLQQADGSHQSIRFVKQ